MPQVGEIKHSCEIGYKGTYEFIWHACIDCGKECWVQLKHSQPRSLRCHSCAMKRRGHPANWNGGQYLGNGYVFIMCPSHPKANYRGYVKRARLLLEGKLGRYLLPGMLPHHINGSKTDDRPENLEEISHSEHIGLHHRG